jgi:hypothetical protein
MKNDLKCHMDFLQKVHVWRILTARETVFGPLASDLQVDRDVLIAIS